jgi:TCP-1/cpn60 chaperonin family
MFWGNWNKHVRLKTKSRHSKFGPKCIIWNLIPAHTAWVHYYHNKVDAIKHIFNFYFSMGLWVCNCGFWQALLAPASLIANNAGVEGEVVVEKVMDREWEVGYNAMTDRYENLVESGVIDPAKVTRCALQNAASVAGMVLTTQAIVVEKPKKKVAAAPGEVPEGSLAV